jgi:hypothetical protein
MLADLTIYAADAVVTARLLFAEDRVSEFLATAVPVDLRHVRITSLDDGRKVALDGLEVGRHEILLAVADTARGRQSRRVATVQHPAIAQVGPYRVVGRVHGPPSTDPIDVSRRRPWFAITDAVVEYTAKGAQVTVRHGAVLVNQAHLVSLVADEDGFHDEMTRSVAGAGAVASGDPGKPGGPNDADPKDAWPTEHGTSSTWR